MINLTSILKKETEGLKVQYIQMTSEWAANEFVRLRNFVARYQQGEFGYGNDAEKRFYRLPYEIVNPNGSKEVYVSKAVKDAERHYEDSIEKLALRIEKKAMNENNLKVQTSHIGVNINTTLTDGEKTVRAFTIIASGEVQRPHYRYLIK